MTPGKTKWILLNLGWISAAAWTAVLGYLLWQNFRNAERQIMDLAYAEARANVNKDRTFRRWATEHGGVYVPITETQKSIPWLSHVPGRDVTTGDGKQLTLLNPASMLRQIMDRYQRDYGIQGRITGLKYLNPANAPDAWEKEQLEVFTRGEKTEVWATTDMNGQPYLRYLRAMHMEPGCEKCHAILGYQLGDMRGATGLNLPLAPYLAQLDVARRNFGASYGLVWLLGLAGIAWSGLAMRKRGKELYLYANIFSHNGEAILITDRDNRIVTANAAFTELTGYTLEEVKGQNPKFLASGKTQRDTYQTMWAALNGCGFWQGELWDRRKDGIVYPKWTAISAICNERREVTHYMASFTDISERKTAEERIDYLARHDALTGLLNRFDLESRLTQSLLAAHRENQMVAVMFIDMDRFKVVNDTLGHHVGDQLLIEVSRRLQAHVRESDIVARLGGDEFVIVLTGMAAAVDASSVANKVLRHLREPYATEGGVLHSTPSIGVSVYPADGADSVTLMKNADTAMYHAKELGRNNIQYFTSEMNRAASERLALEQDLRAALDGGQLQLHYQPQVDTVSGKITGLEALARWHHPVRGPVSPVTFIPIAEESGLIEALGNWVIEEACRQAAAWKAEGWKKLRIAVNLSAHQLRSAHLVDLLATTLARHGLTGDDLEIEVTESVAMEDPGLAIGQLQAIRDLGISLSIDDFGTGYSSLAYLKMLPIQNLKLDRAFVRDIETDPNDAAISTATIALAHSLGLKVIAEGVETEAQREFLASKQCDVLQGYLFGKPEPAAVWSAKWQAQPDLLARS